MTRRGSLHDVPLVSIKRGYRGLLHQCNLGATSFLSLLIQHVISSTLQALLQILYATQSD